MTSISVAYRHSGHFRPLFLKNPAIEETASAVRAQLVAEDTDRLPISTLREISRLNVNGLCFDLWVSLDHPVTDHETGEQVCGLCEFDPGAGEDAVSLLVSPVGEGMTEELVLSTFGHELGHAVFDAPGWIADSKVAPPLSYGAHHGLALSKHRHIVWSCWQRTGAPPMTRILSLALIFFLCAVGYAAESIIDVVVNVQRSGEYFEIKAHYQLPMPRCEAYQFITDYAGATAIPGVLASKVVGRNKNVVKVERVVEDYILFIPVKLRSLIQYIEHPEQGLSFKQLEGDALDYYGTWSLDNHDGVTDFRYSAKFKPHAAIPDFVIQYYIKNRIQKQFAAMANQAFQQGYKLSMLCIR